MYLPIHSGDPGRLKFVCHRITVINEINSAYRIASGRVCLRRERVNFLEKWQIIPSEKLEWQQI